MIRLSVPEIEGGSPERDGEEGEGLVLEYSSSWMIERISRHEKTTQTGPFSSILKLEGFGRQYS